MTKTNKVITQRTQSSQTSWGTSEKLHANLLVNDNPKNWKKLLEASEEQISELFINILKSLPNLSDNDKHELVKTVKTNNRLRLCYHMSNIIKEYAGSISETQTQVDTKQLNSINNSDELKEHLFEVFGSNSYQIIDKEQL